jgi:hypothetical protein
MPTFENNSGGIDAGPNAAGLNKDRLDNLRDMEQMVRQMVGLAMANAAQEAENENGKQFKISVPRHEITVAPPAPYPWSKTLTFGLEDYGGGVLNVYLGACRRGGGPATVRPLGPGTDSDVWLATSPTAVTFAADDGSGQWVVGKWTEASGLEILATPQTNAPSPRDGTGGLYFPIALVSYSNNRFILLNYCVGGVFDLSVFGPEGA